MNSVVSGPVLNPVHYPNQKRRNEMPIAEYLENRPQIQVAATAKSLQSCPTLWDPIDGSLPGFPVPGILQARTLEWVAIEFSDQGSNLGPLHWECGVLLTGPPGKSLEYFS